MAPDSQIGHTTPRTAPRWCRRCHMGGRFVLGDDKCIPFFRPLTNFEWIRVGYLARRGLWKHHLSRSCRDQLRTFVSHLSWFHNTFRVLFSLLCYEPWLFHISTVYATWWWCISTVFNRIRHIIGLTFSSAKSTCVILSLYPPLGSCRECANILFCLYSWDRSFQSRKAVAVDADRTMCSFVCKCMYCLLVTKSIYEKSIFLGKVRRYLYPILNHSLEERKQLYSSQLTYSKV